MAKTCVCRASGAPHLEHGPTGRARLQADVFKQDAKKETQANARHGKMNWWRTIAPPSGINDAVDRVSGFIAADVIRWTDAGSRFVPALTDRG